jgi:hypothetical protein
MSDNRDRKPADLLELQLALVRREPPRPAPVPVLVEAPSEPGPERPRVKRARVNRDRSVRH